MIVAVRLAPVRRSEELGVLMQAGENALNTLISLRRFGQCFGALEQIDQQHVKRGVGLFR